VIFLFFLTKKNVLFKGVNGKKKALFDQKNK